MNVQHYVFAALLGLLLVGCQSSFDTDVLERELRMQEDYIYELQDEIEQYKRALDRFEKQDEKETSAVKRAPAASKGGANGGDGSSSPADFGPEVFQPPTIEPGIPVEPGNPPTPSPSGESGTSSEPETPSEPPPSADRAGPDADTGAAADLLPEPGDPTPKLVPEASVHEVSSRAEDVEPPDDNGSHDGRRTADGSDDKGSPERVEALPIEEIMFDHSKIRGLEVDGQPGDDGIVGVIRARSASGKKVLPAGDLSIMAITSSPHGEPKRLARWDFTAAELSSRQASEERESGLSLDLPWPAGPPTTGPLKLWARLLTADGRKLLTRIDMQIDQGGGIAVSDDATPQGPAGTGTAWEARGPQRASGGWAARALEAAKEPAAARPISPNDVPHLATRPDDRQGPTTGTPDRPAWKPYR